MATPAAPTTTAAALAAVDDGLKKTVISAEQCRIAIAALYVNAHDAAPKEVWRGEDGTISMIMKELHICPGSRGIVVDVLKDVSQSVKQGKHWKPKTKKVRSRLYAACGH